MNFARLTSRRSRAQLVTAATALAGTLSVTGLPFIRARCADTLTESKNETVPKPAQTGVCPVSHDSSVREVATEVPSVCPVKPTVCPVSPTLATPSAVEIKDKPAVCPINHTSPTSSDSHPNPQTETSKPAVCPVRHAPVSSTTSESPAVCPVRHDTAGAQDKVNPTLC